MTTHGSSTRPGRARLWMPPGIGWMLAVSAMAAQPMAAGAQTTRCADCARCRCQLVEPPAPADGVYGRFDGDLDLGVALGGELEPGAQRAAARLSVHYFSTAGVYASYRDALRRSDPDARLVSFGLDLRPLFIPRWSQGWETGPALLDLLLDSTSLGLGAYWGSSASDARASRGLELGLGWAVPLFVRASGPWIGARGLVRWPEPMLGGHELSALATLEWHWIASSPWL